MIQSSDIEAVGKFLKPHGVNGEITVLRDFEGLDFSELSCIIVDIDGIFVPFFINGVRPKGAETDLLTIDGISDEVQAAGLTNKTVYALAEELPEEERDGEGFYASDLVGYHVFLTGSSADTDKTELGKVVGLEDSTANFLLIVETPAGKTLLIPVAEEYIGAIDSDRKTIEMELPAGLLEMQ